MSDAARPASWAERQASDTISGYECRAIRAFDDSPNYSRREIAFLLECKAATVKRHADHRCAHDVDIDGDEQAAGEFLESVGGQP